MNHQKKRCPRCQRELKPDAPGGLCPTCLMEINLQSGVSQPAGRGSATPLPVEEVAKRFPEMEILGLLGSGGMGAVYKVRQPKLDRLVALKILSHERDDADFIERFTREAQTLARLDHPNIVAVHDFGEREGLFFLIMELVDGVTLRDLLSEGRLKPEQALAIVPPICDALQFAHEKGVVHRDIKPENILMDKAGVVKVADFGIARMAGADREQNLTEEGQVVGTAHYMAPEQVERPASVDHRADIYALGVVFYEMLTGELPLGRFSHPSKKVQIDVRLDEVVLKALEKEPEQRYQQASEVRTRVETIAGSPAASGSVIASASPRDWVRKRVLGPAIGLMAVGGLNFLLALYLLVGVLGRPGGMISVFPFAIWAFGIFAILFGAFQMMRLQSYGWAIAGAIIAMLWPPGFLLGLPFGIWALAVLSQGEVRASFPRGTNRATGGDSPVAKRVLWTSGAVLAVVAVGGILLVIAGIIAAIVLPALARAPAEVQAQVGTDLSATLPDSRSDELHIPMPLPGPKPDPIAATQMVQAFKGQFFSAYTALIEKDDPETALVVMRLMDSQTDEFLAKLEGTPAEHAASGGIAQLRLAMTALEEGKIEQAKMLLEGLNSMGAEFEKMINQTAADSSVDWGDRQ